MATIEAGMQAMREGDPRTINELFNQAMQRRADRVLMRYKRDKVWQDITGRQLNERVQNLCLALYKLGVRPGDRVALLAESSPEWSITDYAVLACGAILVPIYPTQAVEQVGFILSNSVAKLLFISNHKQIRRIQAALDSLRRDAPKVILFESTRDEKFQTLAGLEQLGGDERTSQGDLFAQLSTHAQPEDLATIIYTSGTTGDPKGVMLTHRNLTSDTLQAAYFLGPTDRDTALSFLPLSHVFERTVHYIFMHCGVQINFARGVETVAEDIKEVRPTVVTGVPRLFEKIYATI
ncbi:MAG TPA: AMP-binding protein, partial [Blastocatellia bacterium]|nr:AMP-binding protein [Blastocatellia bacterium]